MDISTDAIKGASPEGTKSNEDSGVVRTGRVSQTFQIIYADDTIKMGTF